MSTNTQKELAAAKASLAKLEKAAAAEHKLHRKLAKLPAKYGFSSAAEFAEAVVAAAGGKRGRKARAKKATGGGRKARVAITPEIKAKVKAMVEGGKTGGEIVKSTGISLPSVQNIKRELGLTKKRAK